LRAAMMKAEFSSLRGGFKFNTNHYPIQDFYLVKVAKRPDGKVRDPDRQEGVRELRRPPTQGLHDEVRHAALLRARSGHASRLLPPRVKRPKSHPNPRFGCSRRAPRSRPARITSIMSLPFSWFRPSTGCSSASFCS
jgi:hypothetical protein